MCLLLFLLSQKFREMCVWKKNLLNQHIMLSESFEFCEKENRES